MNACSDTTKFSYGWRDPNATFSTIMAYTCQTGQCDKSPKNGCTRIQRFSTSKIIYNGLALGNAANDNAREISMNAALVASYFTAVSPQPTQAPSVKPRTLRPSQIPSYRPTTKPSSTIIKPSIHPTNKPTFRPTTNPTFSAVNPTKNPTRIPTFQPSTSMPSENPSKFIVSETTNYPTITPSPFPATSPSLKTMKPTKELSRWPSQSPMRMPSENPSIFSVAQPSELSTNRPTLHLSTSPMFSTATSINVPSSWPLVRMPSQNPSNSSITDSSKYPSETPTYRPTTSPTCATVKPTSNPLPTLLPSAKPKPQHREQTLRPTVITVHPSSSYWQRHALLCRLECDGR